MVRKTLLRILHVNAGNLYGGIEVLLATLWRSTKLFGTDTIDYAVFFEGRSATELRKLGAAVHVLGSVQLRNPIQIWAARRNLRRLLARERYDAVICHGAWNQVIAGPVVRETAIPLIVWLHDPPQEQPNAIERWASRTPPDFVVCNSRYTLQRLPRLYAQTPAEVLYCPVDTPQPADPAAARERWRSENGVAADEVMIVQIARLEPHKGHRNHIEALSNLRDMPGWRSFIVGHPQKPEEKAELEHLRGMARLLGVEDRICFLGWQSDIVSLLAAADICCQPNGQPEPFGIIYVEALAAGLACIASAAGGPIEILEGGYGKLIQPGDIEGLTAALREVIGNPEERARLRGQGPARAAGISDPAQQITAMESMLRAVSSSGQMAARKAC